jgi:signal transduction histidine kinase
MMIMAFIAIFIITYRTVQRDIEQDLIKLLEFNRPSTDSQIYPDLISAFALDADFYRSALNSADLNQLSGRFKLNGYYWAFMTKPYFNGYRTVFLDITSRQAILTRVTYTFLLTAGLLLIVIFFISQAFANKSIKPIQEAFEKQKQFITDASHELKTPLAIINANLDVLVSNGEDTISSQSKWLNYIRSETDRMSKLVNELLYLTQVDHSDLKMIYSNFNLSEILEDIILSMEAVMFEKNITLDYKIEPRLISYGNSGQIKQVIIILLDNAQKYINDHGSVNVSLSKKNSLLLLSVSNTGPGIPSDQINKIFDRFYRIDKSRTRNNDYGLGWAIAKTIVEQHRGRIAVKSILREKTTFTVELPAASDHKNKAPQLPGSRDSKSL